LYIYDVPQTHVDRLRHVAPGKWYFDYARDKVYVGSDPRGARVEISVAPRAFGGKASNVVIRNLVIEKYASPLQLAAVDAEYGDGWFIHDNVIQLNHGVGANAGPNSRILRNRLVRNGQQGFDGAGSNFLFEGNEIAYNNYAGVNYKWEAGGGKVTNTTRGSVIRGNCVHDNDGPGIWADESVRDLTIESNVVFNNSDNGIMYEISYDGTIKSNIVGDNGKKGFRWYWGPQILVSNSSNVWVSANWIDVPAAYGHAITIVSQNRKPYSPGVGNVLENNTIVLRGTSGRVASATDVRSDRARVAAENSSRKNVYHVASLGVAYWEWDGRKMDWLGIRRLGQEGGSTIDDILPAKPPLDCRFLGLD
jgi:parallel beta-helix repeat protein